MDDDKEDKPSLEEIKQIADRLKYLEDVARDTVARLYAIETRLGLGYRPAAGRADAPRQPQRTTQPPALSGQVQPPPRPTSEPSGPTMPPTRADIPPSAPAPEVRTPTPASAAQSRPRTTAYVPGAGPSTRPRVDLESRIGGNWFNRIGIIAICFGVAFFLKYAFDNEWIGPGGRVSIGVAIGIAFLVGGERLRKRYASYAYGLTGGGLAILYLAIWFASQNRYNLIPQMLAFILMAVVTATGSLLAARYDALPIAVLALIGGFLTPILLSDGVDNEIGLFGYIAVLDAGVLALAYSKRWRGLNYLAFIATALMFSAWLKEWYGSDKLWTTIFFLTLFFVIFALLAVLYNVVNKRPTTWPDLALVFINALLYFGTSYELLDQANHSVLGAFAVLVSGFYLALGYFTNRRDREDTLLIYTFVGLAVLFAVLAVPIQFDQHWVTIAWALEGAVLTLIGLKANDKTSRYAALVVFVIAASHWVMVDVHDFAYSSTLNFVPLFNRRALSGGVLVIMLAGAAFFYKLYGTQVEESERSNLAGLYALGANMVALAVLSIDANDYFEQARSRQPGDARSNEVLGRLIDGHRLTLTALWAMYGAAMLIAGVARRLKPIRIVGLLLLGITTVKVLVTDTQHYDASWHFLIFNTTFTAFAMVVVALAVGAWFYWHAEHIDKSERTLVATALVLVANLLALIALSAEAAGYFDRALAFIERGRAGAELESTKQLTLSMLWSVYGAAALFIGVRRGLKLSRWGALILLTITGVKLLAVDIGYYDAEWHKLIFNQTFAGFAILVASLSCGVAFYSRADKVAEPERSTAINSLMVAANLLAVIGLSAEALGHYGHLIGAGGLAPDTLIKLELAQRLSLSMVWMVYGGAMLAIGLWRGNKLLRYFALSLLGLAILKVFFIDLSSLEKLYRIISFIVLGAILLAVSFLYQRLRQRAAEPGELEVQTGAQS
ncbi:MAG TPA: DUF2339 domain-containing protein [Blastocatellia bacterium]|nr:DUF2339 domain-containing protein [Blastocatellia bacterium]